MDITITLTDAQAKALAYVALSPQEWAENSVHLRADQAIDEIYNMEVARMTADPDIDTIPANKNAVVISADVESEAVREAARQAILDARV
tara:strand:- start:75 stop:344 length:270 start_codon:yes stop_codon:yes gene_type:complete